MNQRKNFTHLRDVLSDLFPNVDSIHRIVDDSGIEQSHINFSTTVINIWHAVLTEAEKNSQVETLLEVARREYEKNEELRSACDLYFNEMNQSFGTNFSKGLRLDIKLMPGHATPLLKDLSAEEADRFGISKGAMGINEYPLDQFTIPDDKLPNLYIAVTNHESYEVELAYATIEFKQEIRLSPEVDRGYIAFSIPVEHPTILRPGGVINMRLPVHSNAVIEAFCTGKVSGVYVEDNQKFKCYAPKEELAKVGSYFEKFFRHIDIDKLRMRYAEYL